MIILDSIDDIIALLNSGGVILYPTDTVWGLGCDATQKGPIEKIYNIKERQPEKAFVLLVSSLKMLKNYITHIHPRIETLLSFHTHPLTIIYQANDKVPAFSKSAEGTVAIRIVNDSFCKTLIEKFGKPLVSTSANKAGNPFPQHFGEVSSEIIKNVDYVVKHKQQDKTIQKPSVLVSFNHKGDLKFLRT